MSDRCAMGLGSKRCRSSQAAQDLYLARKAALSGALLVTLDGLQQAQRLATAPIPDFRAHLILGQSAWPGLNPFANSITTRDATRGTTKRRVGLPRSILRHESERHRTESR